jgi:hypothetical protein
LVGQYTGPRPDSEKPKKFTQSKFDIYFFTQAFFCFLQKKLRAIVHKHNLQV